MLLEITLLVAAGLGNLAWDLTGRRVSARSRRKERRARRPDSLPLPTPQGPLLGAEPSTPTPTQSLPVHPLAPAGFVESTRVIVEELDRVVDHFDLVLLRAEAGESLVGDVVYIGAEAPRSRGRELIERWVVELDALPPDLRERLRDLGLPDRPVRALVERERERSHWPNASTSSQMLEATASDLERAVVLLAGFLRTLTSMPANPYR